MKFILKPIFIGWSTLVTQLPLNIFFGFWSGGFFGGMFHVYFEKYMSLPVSPSVLIGGLTFVSLMVVVFIVKKFNYEKTEYKFYGDRLEFEEGFLTINKKVIKFQDIKEVTLRRGILQRVNGLGTIYLATLATGAVPSNPFSSMGFGDTSASGISIKDVKDPEEEYKKIRRIIETHKSEKT